MKPWNKGNRKYHYKCPVCFTDRESFRVQKYCSSECYNKTKTSEMMRQRGLKGIANRVRKPFLMNNGYKLIYVPDHPFAKKTAPEGYVYEHRLIMEKKLGRYLKPEEIVHHSNEIKTDNRADNLILTNHQEHAQHHFHTHHLK